MPVLRSVVKIGRGDSHKAKPSNPLKFECREKQKEALVA